jgi:hypothetical protein
MVSTSWASISNRKSARKERLVSQELISYIDGLVEIEMFCLNYQFFRGSLSSGGIERGQSISKVKSELKSKTDY